MPLRILRYGGYLGVRTSRQSYQHTLQAAACSSRHATTSNAAPDTLLLTKLGVKKTAKADDGWVLELGVL
jgi:hypothetical protein